MSRKLLALALALSTAVALLPYLVPAGPTSLVDASSFLRGGRFLVAAGVVFLAGLLTSLTPCVYPLIPITVGVFGARQAESRGKAVLLTSAYVLGMGVLFSALGVAAALSGKAFGSALGSAWVASGLALFLLALASSMFGAFELALPPGLAARLSAVGGGGLGGALLMGSAAGLLAAPCTGPVLASVLAYVATSRSVLLGGGLLFLYALGIGVPFFLLGVFTLRLPKAGEWMEWVKSGFGVLLVALALLYLRDALPSLRGALKEASEALGHPGGVVLASLFTFGGIAIGAIHRSFKGGAGAFLLKGGGVLVVVGALLLRAGASDVSGPGALAQRLGWTEAGERGVRWDLQFPTGGGKAAFEQLLERARREGRPVMIDFFAEWCTACKELDREVYVNPAVMRELERFLSVKVDATEVDERMDELFERFGVQGLPTVAFVDSEGKLVQKPKVTGFLPPEKFLAQLRGVR